MDFHAATIHGKRTVSAENYTARATQPIVDILGGHVSGGPRFLIVEDDNDIPLGVLNSQDIADRIGDSDSGELIGLMSLPAEVALQNRLDVSHTNIPVAGGHVDLNEVTVVSHNGHTIGLISQEDMSVSWKAVAQTLSHAHWDCVTGLPDRTTFNRQLSAECNRAIRGDHSVAVVLVDLDHFKQINDTWGHAAGDETLRTVSKTLRSTLRSYDLVARLGGDEFVALCCGCRAGEIDIVIARLQQAVDELRSSPSGTGTISGVSIGACVAHDVACVTDPAELVKAADICLYAAKNAGRNCAFKWEFTVFGKPEPTRVGDQSWCAAPAH